MLQLLISRVGRIASGKEHNPKALSQIVLVLSHNLPQTAPNTIAHNRASNAMRSNEAYAPPARIRYWRYIERQQFAALSKAVTFHVFKFRRLRQASAFGKRE
jgi:hypothetical protein